MYHYKVKDCRVIDGDTVEAVVDLGFGISNKQRFRLRGYDAPEMKQPGGVEVKEFLTSYVMAALTKSDLSITTYKLDIYGRYGADLFLESSGTNINSVVQDYMLSSGHVKP